MSFTTLPRERAEETIAAYDNPAVLLSDRHWHAPLGRRRQTFAAILAGIHAPLVALLAHGALSSAAGLASRRPTGSALVFTLGATVLGSAVSVRELVRLDRTLRSLEEISRRDRLTGAYNRRAGEERLAEDLARASRDDSTIALAALDLDGLKVTNDSLGHAAGDALIQRAADALRRNLREGDWFARWGGDEFVLALPGTADREAAAKVLERVAGELREERLGPLPHSADRPADGAARPTFSAGVVLCGPGDDPRRCLARADVLLYEAKRRGRARIVREAREPECRSAGTKESDCERVIVT